MQGKAADAYIEAASYIEDLAKTMNEVDFIVQQIFTVGETALNW